MKNFTNYRIKNSGGFFEIYGEYADPTARSIWGPECIGTFDISPDRCPTFDLIPTIRDIRETIGRDNISISGAQYVRRNLRHYYRNYGAGR